MELPTSSVRTELIEELKEIHELLLNITRIPSVGVI